MDVIDPSLALKSPVSMNSLFVCLICWMMLSSCRICSVCRCLFCCGTNLYHDWDMVCLGGCNAAVVEIGAESYTWLYVSRSNDIVDSVSAFVVGVLPCVCVSSVLLKG